MKEKIDSKDIKLTPFDNQRLINLCGRFDEHIKLIEERFNINIYNRGNIFQIKGSPKDIELCSIVLQELYRQTGNHKELDPKKVHLVMLQTIEKENTSEQNTKLKDEKFNTFVLKTPQGNLRPRTKNQAKYLSKILEHDITFAIGPAGTGKTYLAVAAAVRALQQQKVRKIILVRPVVEAGEHLGFLPGDLTQKIDPYLLPLYDSLYEILGHDKVIRYLEQNIIEIAPLAYMRGRTLNDAFIILDEGQNTTKKQMQMFLTRIGFNSIAVITGDITQIDLPRKDNSGLIHCKDIVKGIEGICVVPFETVDVIRHPVVQRIIDAYDKFNDEQKK